MNKQIEFGLRLRKEFAVGYNFESWEKFTAYLEEKDGSVGESFVQDLEELVEAAAELHMTLCEESDKT